MKDACGETEVLANKHLAKDDLCLQLGAAADCPTAKMQDFPEKSTPRA
jgi:hypothetical protein